MKSHIDHVSNRNKRTETDVVFIGPIKNSSTECSALGYESDFSRLSSGTRE